MDKREFYERCDLLLEQTNPPPREIRYRGRWGPREPGPGRYKGYGLIRWFGLTIVHVSITHPIAMNVVVTPIQAIKLLENIKTQYSACSNDNITQ